MRGWAVGRGGYGWAGGLEVTAREFSWDRHVGSPLVPKGAVPGCMGTSWTSLLGSCLQVLTLGNEAGVVRTLWLW